MVQDNSASNKGSNKGKASPEPAAGADSLANKGGEFLEMYNKVAKFIQELMQENNHLKQKVEDLRIKRNELKSHVSTGIDEKLAFGNLAKKPTLATLKFGRGRLKIGAN